MFRGNGCELSSFRIIASARHPTLFALFAILATATPARAAGAAPGHTVTRDRPLSWFAGDDAPILLRNETDSASVTIPVAAGRQVSQAELQLNGVNSASLLPGESQLLVALNGHPIRQIGLDGGSPRFRQTILLPGRLFTPGYDTLTFSVAQTYRKTCGSFDAPQLWTRISAGSRLALTYADRPLTLSLGQLDAVFDKHVASHHARLTILYGKSLAAAPQGVMAAAQSVAVRYDHVPLRVVARPLDRQSFAMVTATAGNVILLGTGAELLRAAASNPIPVLALRSAYLALSPNPSGGAVLAIAGRDPATIARAAGLIGLTAIAWPNRRHAMIDLPPEASSEPASVGPAGAPSTTNDLYLGTLGFRTATSRGRDAHFAPVSFWNPDWGSRAMLMLHLAYSGGAAPGSVLDVLVNDALVGTIPLSNPAGGTYPDYKISIPENVLRPGENRLALQPVFRLRHVSFGSCVPHDYGNALGVTLFSDSHLAIIAGSRIAPDNLGAIGARSLTIRAIALATASPRTISAAATLGAKLAQLDHLAGLRLIAHLPSRLSDDTIVMGSFKDLPPRLAHAAGLAPTPAGATLIERWNVQHPNVGPSAFEQLPSWLTTSLRLNEPDTLTRGSTVTVGTFARATIAAITHADDRTIVVLAASSPGDLARGVNALVGGSRWAQFAGHAAIITPGASRIETLPTRIIPVGLRARFGYVASRNALWAILAIVLLLVALVIVVRAAIGARHRRRHPTIKTRDEAS